MAGRNFMGSEEEEGGAENDRNKSPLVAGPAVMISSPRVALTIPMLVGTNAVVAGLEVAASVAFTFIPPLLLKSGFGETQMSVIFGIGKTNINRKRKIKTY